MNSVSSLLSEPFFVVYVFENINVARSLLMIAYVRLGDDLMFDVRRRAASVWLLETQIIISIYFLFYFFE